MKTNSLTLAFGHVTWKSIGVIYLLGASTLVTSLGSFQWRGQEILSGHFFQRLEFFTLTFDHVTSKSIEVIYFQMASFVPNLATFKQSGQEILNIERTSLGLQTDRQVQNNIPPFFKKKKINKQANALNLHAVKSAMEDINWLRFDLRPVSTFSEKSSVFCHIIIIYKFWIYWLGVNTHFIIWQLVVIL